MNRRRSKRTGTNTSYNLHLRLYYLVKRKAIEQEKVVYKESFDKLRTVKPEIEHIRKVQQQSFLSKYDTDF